MANNVQTMKNFVGCLDLIGKAYNNIGDRRHFAYSKATSSMKDIGMRECVKRMSKHEKIPYVGESISDKYAEYLKTGKIAKMAELKIGLTQKKPKSNNPHKNYMLRNEAEKLVKPLYNYITKWLSDDVTYTGSFRRLSDYVGDMDMLIITPYTFFDIFDCKKGDIVKINKSTTIEVAAIGEKKMKVVLKNIDTRKKIEVDLRIFKSTEKATALMYFTGSASENIKLRSVAKRNGMKLSEYGITDKTGKLHHFKTEQAVYKYLGVDYKEPNER